MAAWHEVEQAAPEFAQRIRAVFDAHRHKTIATLRADGSARISGIEAAFEDGELVFGTHLNEAATMLVVDWWTPTRGLRRIERA
jgi:hypothetical protein